MIRDDDVDTLGNLTGTEHERVLVGMEQNYRRLGYLVCVFHAGRDR
jgi:hypothetical protein